MTTKRDYYEILEVRRNASPEDIKKAFRKQALRYHPDRNREADASARFKEVNEAYQVLNDPQRKAVYDQFGHAGLGGNGGTGRGFEGFEGFGGFGDIFDAFFGGATRRGAHRGTDLEYLLTVPFRDAAFGTERELELDRLERCGRCDGSRAEPGTQLNTCGTCKGSGQVRRVQKTVFGQFQQVTTCSTCGGEGQTVETPCTQCRGIGTERKRRRIAVEIPAGIEDGSRIRMRSQGEPGERGGEPGDLYVHVRVEEDPVFVRRGNDVLVTLDINMAQAALGADLEAPTLDGVGRIKVHSGTQSGQSFRLKNAGIPHLGRSNRRGDELVTVRVVTPSKLTARQKELLEELADSLQAAGVAENSIEGGFFGKVRDVFTGDEPR